MLNLVLYLFLWFLVGYGSGAFYLYREYQKGKDVTIADISFFGLVGFAGPALSLALLILAAANYMSEHGDTVVFKKEDD